MMKLLGECGLTTTMSEANFVTVWFKSAEAAYRFRNSLASRAQVLVLGDDSHEFDMRGFSGGFARICLPPPYLLPELEDAIRGSIDVERATR